METLSPQQKQEKVDTYKKGIAPETEEEVLVHVVEGMSMWWGPTPRLHMLRKPLEEGGENFMVPMNVFLNADYHNPRKAVNGAVIRGVLERADRVKPAAADTFGEDIAALVARNRELERQLSAFTGQAAAPLPQLPIIVVPDTKREEI